MNRTALLPALCLIVVLSLIAMYPPPSAAATRSVTTYGAKCDGRKDDTAAIQAALAAANGGDTVIFPANKTCKVTDELRPKAGTALQGLPGSRISQAANKNLLVVTTDGVSTDNLTLRFDGNATQGPNVIRVEGGSNFYFYNTTIERAGGWQVYLLGGCHHGTLNGLVILNNTTHNREDGVDVAECHDISIRRFNIDTNDDAISVKSYDNGLGGTHHIEITNGTLRSRGSAAIKFGDELGDPMYAIAVNDIDMQGHFGIQFKMDGFRKDGSPWQGSISDVAVDDVRQTGNNWASLFVQKYDSLSRTANITINRLIYVGSVLDCVHIMQAAGFALSNLDCNSPARDGRYSVWLESAAGNTIAGQSHGFTGGMRLDASPGNTLTVTAY